MIVTAQADKEQLEGIDVTITITMPLRHWRVIKQAVGSSQNYHAAKQDLALAIESTINRFTERVDGEKSSM